MRYELQTAFYRREGQGLKIQTCPALASAVHIAVTRSSLSANTQTQVLLAGINEYLLVSPWPVLNLEEW